MKKPAVVIPIPNHAEQWINANLIEKKGLGLVATEANIQIKIEEIILNFKNFKDACEKNLILDSGARQAADLIRGLLE